MRLLPFIALLFLAACGFTPVYSSSQSLKSDLTSISVATIPDRDGQIIRNHLIDHLYSNGYPNNPKYSLVVSRVEENIVEIGIDKDDDASRAQLRQKTTMRLIDLEKNKTLLVRPVRATSGYNILTDQFASYSSEKDARLQTLKALSDNILTQLELYFQR